MAGFSASMLREERELRLCGRIKYITGAEYALEAEDFVSASISEGIDSGILPGAVLSAACTIVINNEDGRFDIGGARRGQADMAGAEIELRIEVKNDAGEWLFGPMGVYYVDEARSEVNSPVVTLECHDGIFYKTGAKFDDRLSYPCSVKDVFAAAAVQAGYVHDGSGISGEMMLDEKPDWGEDATVRDVLGYAAALAGGCVMADRWGFLTLRKLAGERTAYSIYPQSYMARSFREGRFGPVNRLKICTVNGLGDGDSEAQEMEFSADVGYGECALEIKTNPLFVTGAAGAAALGRSMMDAVAGLEYASCAFSWRGDPDIMPGRYIRLIGVDGEETFCTVSRQTLVFDGGFRAECVCGVPGDGEIRRNALGWAGKVNAGDIVGTISGAKIAADSITTRKIAAGAVNADKIAAGAITADKIAAGAINAGAIAAGGVTADKIEAGTIRTEHIAAGTVTAESGIIANGAIGTAQIADGSITSAKVVELNADVIKSGTLSAERLLLVGDDGVIYRINAASSGLSLTELSKDQYKHYINGTVIVAKSITAAQIAARTITSNEILAGTITAKEINVLDLFASQATINALNAMDISGNKYLRLMVSDAANSVRVGGTQLIPESRSFGSGWKFWNASSYGYGSGAWPGYNRTRQNMSGITNEWQSCITTPLIPLPEDWDGRQVTLSAYLSATLWSAVDNGITWTLCLSDGSTERGYYFNKYNVVVPGTAQWGSDMQYDRQPAAGQFVRAWTTYDMAEANFTAITEDYSYADCTHMFVQFWLRQNGDLRMVAPKLEWGNRATDWSYAPDDIDTDIAGLQSQIDLLPGAIELAVKEVQVGGTNLLMRTRDLTTDDSRTDCWWLGSGRTRSDGDGDAAQIDWRITGDTANNWRAVKSPIFRLPDGWQGNKAAVSLWVYSDNWAAMDYGMRWRLFLTAGDRSESYRYAQAQILDAGGAAGADMQGSTPENGKWKRIWAVFDLSEAGFTNGSGSLSGATHAWVGYYCVKNVTMSMKKPQFEIGNKPTAWSPNPEEFHAGSAVTITRDEVKISTPEFNVDIVGADGETNMLSIDENGAQMRSLTAPDVAPRYAGPATLYVNPAATSAQIAAGNYYRSLADALAALSNRWISSNVVINLAAGMTEYGRCALGGTAGQGIIYIRGDASKRAKLVGSMAIHYNGCPVMITNLNIDTGSGGSAIDCAGAQTFVIAENCILTGAGVNQSVNGMWSRQGAKVDIHTCEIYDFNAAVKVEQTGVAQVYGCKGNCYVRINMGTMYATGSMPSGGTAWDAEVWGGALHTSGITVNQGSKPTPAPAPTTSTVTANATRSYTNAWRQSDTEIRQGYYSGMGEWAGCMWFPTSSFSGKTIKTASLTLTRTGGSGRSGAVTLTLYGITIASASGNPHTGKVSYGVIGTIENGETKTFTLPTAAGQAMANGTIKGFMLYAGDGKAMSGRDYSYNYCKIESGGTTKPVLNVMY